VTTPGRRACLVGVGETRYAKWGGITDTSEHALALEAILAAVDDAGLTVDDVDGLGSFADDRNQAIFLAADLGLPELRWADMVWLPGGGGAAAAVHHAVLAVEAGVAEVVVVYRSLCQGQFGRFGQGPGARRSPEPPRLRRARTLLDAEIAFTMPFGMFNPPIAYAMVLRRHMHLYGTTTEHFGHVAVTMRDHARRNPRAVMGGRPLTLADHQASRWVAEPFRLYDCCLENDGACAVVVTTESRAADLRHRPIAVVAGAEGTPYRFGHGQYVNVNLPDEWYASGGGRLVAERLYARAGLTPNDVDVAMIYDHFSGLVLLTLEDFGFCGRGESGDFVAAGGLRADGGALPTNTHGGSLSEAYIHGLNHVVEGVRQLRGQSTWPVPNAEVCLVTAAAGVPTSALLLGAA
jgi:acetyl-CoA acetyltransferase